MSTDTTDHATRTQDTSRIRRVAFWVLMVALLFLHLGDRPQMLLFPVIAFGDETGHQLHMFAQGLFAWTVLAAVVASLVRPARQIAAAWTYTLATVVTFALLAAFADLPADVVPILFAGIGVAVVAFLVHPVPLRAKLTPVARPDIVVLVLAVVGTIPLAVYAVGQLGIHLSSGPADEHFAFGHWVIMAAVATLAAALAFVAALRFDGWRLPLWLSGVTVALLGVASLVMTTASQLSTLWSITAIAWGIGFVIAGERVRTSVPVSAR